MTTKLSAKLAIGALAAALAIGVAPVAGAAESAAQAAPVQTAPAIPSPSTPVGGVLTDPHGHPLPRVELHFQGRVNPDIFTIRTRADGSFSTALPPGIYDLRDEHGAIIADGVTVARSAVSLGRVEAPAPLAPTRLFDRQAMGEVIVKSPAPSGAYVPAPGEVPAPVAVIPAPHPLVQGGTAGGKRMAPAQVVPMGVEQQLQLPPGAETTIGVPSMAGETPAPTTGAPSAVTGGMAAPPTESPTPAGAY